MQKLVAILLAALVAICIASDASPFDRNNTFRNSDYSKISIFRCNDTTLSDEGIGPNFDNISSSSTRNESIATISNREYAILSYYAKTALPPNDSSDDYNNTIFMKIGPPTNPMLNSRDDVRRVVNRYISRILLGCYNNSDMDDIFLSDTARPFAEPGSSSISGDTCFMDGDYDFSTIDFLDLLYVARRYPGSMPDNVFRSIRDKLLSINGTITTQESYVPCRLKIGPIRFDVTVQLEYDTENHVLQTEVSRYLTNQLLIEEYPDNDKFDNNKNGNTKWLVEHLSTFLKNYFYEYNSRPYQAFTVKTIALLHSYAMDSRVQLISEMILDMVSSFSAAQMNRLRRFAPFRRQPQYVNDTQSFEGESELFRMAILVGDYGVIASKGNNAVPDTGEYASRFADSIMVNTIASNYRLKDFILDMFIRESSSSNEFFVSYHDTVEMYYSTQNVLISAGGIGVESQVPTLKFQNRFCFFKSCLLEGFFLRSIGNQIISQRTTGERGWAQPTTIIPSAETSTDILDMIRFVGDRTTGIQRFYGPYGRNLCVAPNFACGLQLEYGNVIGPVLNQCSITVGDWRFLNLSGKGNTICPKYGYYMAVYERSCSTQCNDQADNYGLLELSESIESITFAMFQQQVLNNNPNPFTSQGIHTYKPINGNNITFEIAPINIDQSQILQIQGIDGSAVQLQGLDGTETTRAATRDFDSNYYNWPLAWSANGSIQSASMKGRWTYDSRNTMERYIYDVTDALQPKRFVSSLPILIKHSSDTTDSASTTQVVVGQYFDDSSNVIANDTIKSIAFTYNRFSGSITGFRTDWRSSGLYAVHGYTKDESTLLFGVRYIPFNIDEKIITVVVVVGNSAYDDVSSVSRIKIITNQDRIFNVGTADATTTTTNYEIVYNANHIIAFYGHVGVAMIHQLRVVSMS